MTDSDDLDTRLNGVVDRFLAEELTPRGDAPAVVWDDSMRLVEDLTLNSIDVISLLAEVEGELQISIKDEDANTERFPTVGALRQYVREILEGADR